MRRKPLFWALLPFMLAAAMLPVLAGGWWVWGGLAGLGRQLGSGFGLLLVGAALLGAALAALLAHRLGEELRHMTKAAEALGRGELEARMPVPNSHELGGLARAFNHMAGQLQISIGAITQKQDELETVLAHMTEAVLVVDDQERIINCNRSAARMFNLRLEDARGRYLVEMVRNAALIRFVADTMKAAEPVNRQISLQDGARDLVLDAHGTLLRDAAGKNIGALVVLHDLTDLRRLEGIRTDFVANVSHELKSPLTAIQGFVETLQDGALEEPRQARRFLEIISRQVERLMAIVEDLLHLSRIEQEEGRGEIATQNLPLRPVLQAAMQDCQAKAAEKHLQVELDCPEELTAAFNAPLLEQAVVNLLDNAIKYSPEQKPVRLAAQAEAAEVRISVEDQGSGIPARHLPRLFERFYRVDTARSRELGGTGLGLAIVKHIALAHGGRVAVESRPGRGSSFHIHLPG